MQLVQNLQPLEKKKDDYTTTNHTGVNGPTGPITPKTYSPFTPQVNFMLFASNIIYSMPFTAILICIHRK